MLNVPPLTLISSLTRFVVDSLGVKVKSTEESLFIDPLRISLEVIVIVGGSLSLNGASNEWLLV